MLLTDSESSVSYAGEHPVRNDGAIWSSSSEYRGTTVVDADVNMVTRHEIHLGFNHCELGLKITSSSCKGSEDMKYIALDEKWTPISVAGNSLLSLSTKGPSVLPVDGESVGRNSSVCQRYPARLQLCTSEGLCCSSRNVQNREWTTMQEKVNCCCSDLTAAKPLNKYVPEQKNECANAKSNWDLNITINTHDDSLEDPVVNVRQSHELDLECVQKEGIESCPEGWFGKEAKGTDDLYGCLSSEVVPTSRSAFVRTTKLDSDIHLDLQLKLPAKPEIRFDWGDAGASGSSAEQDSVLEMTKLSLVTGNQKVLKSEPDEGECRLGLNIVELHNLKSVDECAHSESLKRVLLDNVAVEDRSTYIKRSDTGEIKLEPQGQCQATVHESIQSPEGSCFPQKAENGTMAYGAEAPKDLHERMVLDLNFVPVGYDGGSCHDGMEMHFEANIDMNANILIDADEKACSRLASHDLSPIYNDLQQSGRMARGSSPQNPNQIRNDASCKLAVECSGDCLSSDFDEPRVDFEPEISEQTGSVRDDSSLSNSTSEDMHSELGTSMPAKSDAVEIDMPIINILEQNISMGKNESFKSHEVASDRDVSPEKKGANDHLEDGEAGDSNLLHEVMDGPGTADCDFFAETGPVENHCSLSKSGTLELHVELSRISKPAEIDGLEIDMSISTLEKEYCDKKYESDNSNEVISAMNLSLEKRGDDGSSEDGEVRELNPLHHAEDGPSHELKTGLEGNRHSCGSSFLGRPPAGSSKDWHVKTSFETRNEFLDTTKEINHVPTMSKSYRNNNGRQVSESNVGGLGRQHTNTIESDRSLVKPAALSKPGSTADGEEMNFEGWGWHRPDSAPNRKCSTETKSGPSKPMIYYEERNMSGGKSFNKNKPSHPGAREERFYWKSKLEGRGRPVGEHGTNSTFTRKAENRSGALESDPWSVPDHVSQRPDSRTTSWPPWPERAQEGHEVATTVASDYQFGRPVPDNVSQRPDSRTTSWPPWPERAQEGHEVATSVASDDQFGRPVPDHVSQRPDSRTASWHPWPESAQEGHEVATSVASDDQLGRSVPDHVSQRPDSPTTSWPSWSEGHEVATSVASDDLFGRSVPTHLQSRGPPIIFGDTGHLDMTQHAYQDRRSSRAHKSLQPVSDAQMNIHAEAAENYGPTPDNYYHKFVVATECGDSGSRNEIVKEYRQIVNGNRHHRYGSDGYEASQLNRSRAGMDRDFIDRGHLRSLGRSVKNRLGNRTGQHTDEVQEDGYAYHHREGWNGVNSNNRNEASQPNTFGAGMDIEFRDRGRRSIDRSIQSRLGNRPGHHRGAVQENGNGYHRRQGWDNGNWNNGRQKKRRFNDD